MVMMTALPGSAASPAASPAARLRQMAGTHAVGVEVLLQVVDVLLSAAGVHHQVDLVIGDLCTAGNTQRLSSGMVHKFIFAIPCFSSCSRSSQALCECELQYADGFVALQSHTQADQWIHQDHVTCTYLGDHSVVDDAAMLVGEHAEGAGAVRDARNVAHHQLLQEGHCVLALQVAQECQGKMPRHGFACAT